MPQLQGCRILFWSPSQPMVSFSKKISRVTILSGNFFSNESDVLTTERSKSRKHCQVSSMIWMYSQNTYLLHKVFGQQNVKNELFSTTWKFPNVNRNATSLVVRLKTAQSLLEKEQETPVLHRLTSAGSQKKLWNVFRRQNLKLSCSDFLDVWSKFNVLV